MFQNAMEITVTFVDRQFGKQIVQQATLQWEFL